MINLRRLSCPAVPFLYILDRYADIRGWDINDTLLRGLSSACSSAAGSSSKAVPGTEIGRSRQKTGLRIWIPQIFYYICRC